MKQILIARRYAKAALQSISPEKYLQTLEQTKSLKLLISQNLEIKKIVASAIIPKQKKMEFISSAVFPSVKGIEDGTFWQSTLKILILKNRGTILDAFLSELSILLDEKLNQKNVILTLAHNQDSGTINKIKSEVERTLNSKIVYDLQIDKGIIGGFIATTDSKMIDASVSSNLKRFEKTIVKR